MYAMTTLNKVREQDPCSDGWSKLLKALGKTKADDEPLSFEFILNSNGIDDAIWALRAIDARPETRLFAIRCVREVQHLLTDERSLNALDVAERYAIGEESEEALYAAGNAARDAAMAAAGNAARDAAMAAAGNVASGDAWRAAWHCVASEAAMAAASEAAGDEAWFNKWRAALAIQEADFRAIFCTKEH